MLRKKKYFTTIKRGEISEWKRELSSRKENVRKEAVKKIIAAMTTGKDVSALFTDVINCSQTSNVELKKLVYLYILNYASQKPDLAILVVSSLLKDLGHDNSLIRGLALRTITSLNVSEILEYVPEPLHVALSDKDPYVRKIAALGVVKFFDRSPRGAIEAGLVEAVGGLLRDPNTMVVANAIAALMEIHNRVLDTSSGSSSSRSTKKRRSGEEEEGEEEEDDDEEDEDDLSVGDLLLSRRIVLAMTMLLPMTSEWCTIHILDALVCLRFPDDLDQDLKLRRIDMILEKTLPLLQHSNPAVIVSAVRLVLRFWNMPRTLQDNVLLEKISKPLVTLSVSLKECPEIQFAVLKNVMAVAAKFPDDVFSDEIKSFFVQYDDPQYVKRAKLGVLCQIVNVDTVDVLLLELRDYVRLEINRNFVRRVIEAIGQCALKLPSCADRVVTILCDILENGRRRNESSATQNAVSVLVHDILMRMSADARREQYAKIVAVALESSLDVVDDPDAKSAVVWLIGEFFDVLENGDEAFRKLFIGDHFAEEDRQVQFAVLTTAVKLFVEHPNVETKAILEEVLDLATSSDCDDPDLRDTAYFYFRLIQEGAAQEVVLDSLEKGFTTVPDAQEMSTIRKRIVEHHMVGTVASVLEKPPFTFVVDYRPTYARYVERLPGETSSFGDDESDDEGSSDEATSSPPPRRGGTKRGSNRGGETASPSRRRVREREARLLTLDESDDEEEDQGGSEGPGAPSSAAAGDRVRKTQKPKDLMIDKVTRLPRLFYDDSLDIYSFVKRYPDREDFYLDIVFANKTEDVTFQGFQVKFNKNPFGIVPGDRLIEVDLRPGSRVRTKMDIAFSDEFLAPLREKLLPNTFEIALRDEYRQIRKFDQRFMPGYLFHSDATRTEDEFLALWESFGGEDEKTSVVDLTGWDPELLKDILRRYRVFYCGRSATDQLFKESSLYFCSKMLYNGRERYMVAKYVKRGNHYTLTSRANPTEMIWLFEMVAKNVLVRLFKKKFREKLRN